MKENCSQTKKQSRMLVNTFEIMLLRTFHIVSDHNHSQIPLKIQHFRMKLMKFTYTISPVLIKELTVACRHIIQCYLTERRIAISRSKIIKGTNQKSRVYSLDNQVPHLSTDSEHRFVSCGTGITSVWQETQFVMHLIEVVFQLLAKPCVFYVFVNQLSYYFYQSLTSQLESQLATF